ncbi:MAG: hypothetical protein H0V89_00225, partial [Deltaproteobacteria bacterium]|nr:hypothetical protein [Deltaproteobacteria bacterium]
MRSVSVLEVAEPSVWTEIEAVAPAGWSAETLDERRRVVTPVFEKQVLPGLRDRILVRYARRDAAQVAADVAEVACAVAR